MSNRFTFYPVLCCATPEMEAEIAQFRTSLAEFAEQVSMPQWVLFPAATFCPQAEAHARKHAIESNIRTCHFFVHIFGGQPPDPLYAGFVGYAAACAADPARPMHRPTILFQDAGAVSAEMRNWRASLAPDCTTIGFTGMDRLAVALRGVFHDWYGAIQSR